MHVEACIMLMLWIHAKPSVSNRFINKLERNPRTWWMQISRHSQIPATVSAHYIRNPPGRNSPSSFNCCFWRVLWQHFILQNPTINWSYNPICELLIAQKFKKKNHYSYKQIGFPFFISHLIDRELRSNNGVTPCYTISQLCAYKSHKMKFLPWSIERKSNLITLTSSTSSITLVSFVFPCHRQLILDSPLSHIAS